MNFKVRDGIELYLEKHLVDNPKSTIIIVHGLGENQSRYAWVTEQLNNNGYNVYRYDHRGHGRSGGKRGYVKHFSVIINDLDDLALTLNGKTRNITKKDFLEFAENIGIHSLAANKLIKKIIKLENEFISLINESFLPEDVKYTFINFVTDKINILK